MAFYEKSPDREEFPAELEALFAAYRRAVPEPEPTAAFMPGLWDRIERQQRVTYSFRKLASGFVTVAAAICLFLSTASWTPPQTSTSHLGTYVDILADSDEAPDSVTVR